MTFKKKKNEIKKYISEYKNDGFDEIKIIELGIEINLQIRGFNLIFCIGASCGNFNTILFHSEEFGVFDEYDIRFALDFIEFLKSLGYGADE